MELTRSPLALATMRPRGCPPCGAGSHQEVVGLFWDRDEASWRCLLCGHRAFDRPRRSEAQVAADRWWEQMFPPEGEDGLQQQEEEESDEPRVLPPMVSSPIS
jgi:hypothetical protein